MLNPIYMRHLIFALGMTQTDAANFVGIDPRTMRGYVSLTKPTVTAKAVRLALEGAVLARCTEPVEKHVAHGTFFVKYKGALHLTRFDGRFWRWTEGSSALMSECITGVFL